jgi:hypothetical protein
MVTGIFLMMAILICGCPYHSTNPLSPVESAKVDRSLLGVWEVRENEKPTGTLRILKFNDQEVLILAYEKGKLLSHIFRAFTIDIRGKKFINLQTIGEEKSDNEKWLLANYFIDGDELKYRLLSDKLFTNEVMTPQELRHLVEQNLENRALYEGGNVIYRLKGR